MSLRPVVLVAFAVAGVACKPDSNPIGDEAAGETESPSTDTDTESGSETDSDSALAISEVDCHGRDAIEIATEPGVDLGGVGIVIHGAVDYTIPVGSISEGLFVVAQTDGVEAGFAADIGCSDDEVALIRESEVLDTWVFPGFPGSFKGTTWCSGVSPDPFDLCTPTIGETNRAYVDPADILFDRLDPVEIDLTLDQAGLDALAIAPREYVAGTFSVTEAGVTTDPIPVGIALKGSPIGSFTDLSGKAAFKIKFDFVDPDQLFLGLEGLKLNNMREDGSQLHEAIGYAIFGAAGVPAPRAGYAEVRLNGESYGLHASLERADDTFLSRHYPTTQHLYEGTFGLDVDPGLEAVFSVDEGDPLDTSDLTALMAVSVVSDAEYLAALQGRVHLAATQRMWAASMWIGHWDGYAAGKNNYELQSDADGVFDFVPSGLDQTSEDLIDLTYGVSPLQERGVLFDRCVAEPACLSGYQQALDDVGTVLVGFDVQAEIDAIAEAIEPWVVADPRRESSVADVHAAQDATRYFWEQRM